MKFLPSLLTIWFGLVGVVSAGEGVWRTDFDQAVNEARQSGRVLVVHFWNESCPPCRRWEAQVASDSAVLQRIEERFIAVKVNTSRNPEIARRFEVTRIPQDVVLSSHGQVVLQCVSPLQASEYLQWLARIEQVASQQGRGLVQAAGFESDHDMPLDAQHADLQICDDTNSFRQQDVRLASDVVEVSAPSLSESVSGGDHLNPFPSARSSNRQDAPLRLMEGGNAQPMPAALNSSENADGMALGLEGFCPIHLMEAKQWVEGQSQWGAIHRGHVYYFSDGQARERFLESPDRFTPFWSGADPVLAVELGQHMKGKREHGLFVEGRVVLFQSEETLKRFMNDSSRYLEAMNSWEQTSDSSIPRAPRAHAAQHHRLQD